MIRRLGIFARYLRMNGADASWRETIGDGRKRIGNFARCLVFVNALTAR